MFRRIWYWIRGCKFKFKIGDWVEDSADGSRHKVIDFKYNGCDETAGYRLSQWVFGSHFKKVDSGEIDIIIPSNDNDELTTK